MQGAGRYGSYRGAFEKARARILATQGICGICGKPVDMSIKYPDPLSPTVDHIIPINKGGHPTDINNLQLAHRWCNRMKSDKYIDRKDLFTKEEDEDLSLPLSFDWKNYKAK